MLCIRNRNPVLCEKAFTANAGQAQELLAYAEPDGVFITDAMCVRYSPVQETFRR